MKRIIILLVILVIMLTGCVSVQYHVKINKDGSIDLDYRMAMDPSVAALAGDEDPIKEARANAEKEGFVVANYTEDNMTGFKATKHINKIKDFSLEGIVNGMGNAEVKKDGLTVKKGLFIDTYKFDTNIDLSSMKSTGELQKRNKHYLHHALSQSQILLKQLFA